MNNLLNIDSTSQISISTTILIFAVLTLVGYGCYLEWELKGVIIYMGILLTIGGLIITYLGIIDTTL